MYNYETTSDKIPEISFPYRNVNNIILYMMDMTVFVNWNKRKYFTEKNETSEFFNRNE